MSCNTLTSGGCNLIHDSSIEFKLQVKGVCYHQEACATPLEDACSLFFHVEGHEFMRIHEMTEHI